MKMSRMPKVDKKPKNNKHNKFRWVDMQWEKFMNRHDEDLKIIDQLREALITCNKLFQKQRTRLLELTMENAELKDKLNNIGEHPETDDYEVGNASDYEIDNQLNLFDD